MNDIAPELLEKIQKSFELETAELRKAIRSGVKTYEEAYRYAIRVGEALSKSFGVNITSEILPDGRMYYNIADKVVRPMLEAEYELSSEAAVSAQRSVNKASGIGIKAQAPEFDADKAQGIIDRVSSQPYDEIKWILNEPVKTFSKNVVDDTIRKNVEFQGKSGLTPKIVRKISGTACEWCKAVAGTYSYPDVPKDVYRRHENCNCVVEYVEGGKHQNVHTKMTYQSKAEREQTIQTQIAKMESDKRKNIEKRNSNLSYNLQFFAKKHKESKVPHSDPLWDSLVQGDVEKQLEDGIFAWKHGGYMYTVEITDRYEYNYLSKRKLKNIHEKDNK